MGETTRLEELKRRVEADPASIAFASLAEEYRRAARFDEAVEASRAGLRFHPTYVSARVTLGRSLMELGLYDQAERELHVVARSTPDNLAARRALGDLYWRQADLVRALEQLRLACGPRARRRRADRAGAGARARGGGVAAASRGAGRRRRSGRRGRRRASGAGGHRSARAVLPRHRAASRRRPAGRNGRGGATATDASGRRADRDPPGQLGPPQLTGDRRRCHGAVVTHPFSGRHARVAETLRDRGRRRARRRQLVQHQVLDGVRRDRRGARRDRRLPLLAGRLPLQFRGRTARPGRRRAAGAGAGVARRQRRLRSPARGAGRRGGLVARRLRGRARERPAGPAVGRAVRRGWHAGRARRRDRCRRTAAPGEGRGRD